MKIVVFFSVAIGTPAPKIQGNTSDYLTARIARDRPDVLERMKAGRGPS